MSDHDSIARNITSAVLDMDQARYALTAGSYGQAIAALEDAITVLRTQIKNIDRIAWTPPPPPPNL